MKKICVLGLGYIGLPTAAMFATHGSQVLGVDINGRIVEILNNGDIHIEEVGLRAVVREAMSSGKLVVREEVEPADAFIIAVPTPIGFDKTADLNAVVSATEAIVPHLREGNLVVLESTSPPRTTTDLIKPILERSGLKAGKDFSLAYSPERVLPGQILKELVENARIIGGIDAKSAEAGRSLYSAFAKEEITLTDATTAEMVKLMENTYRDVNIALANEFALVAEHLGIDVWRAIELANHHPRVRILKPGPGVGGHCIAVDPWFVVQSAPKLTHLIQAGRAVNDSMPRNVVRLVKNAIAEVAHPLIACLGLAYKADVDDIRESPAIKVVRQLETEGVEVRAYDPHVRPGALPNQVRSLEEAIEGSDGAVILTGHRSFQSLAPEEFARRMRRRLLIDCQNILRHPVWHEAGFHVVVLGANGIAGNEASDHAMSQWGSDARLLLE
jgi:UDP-N-acetyl-D-mannosaminuronic acid dehydrogenase